MKLSKLSAKSISENSEVVFYESIAVPKNKFAEDYYNQWRLDFPKNLRTEVNQEFVACVAIALKILTRGSVTILSPYIQDKLNHISDELTLIPKDNGLLNIEDISPSAFEKEFYSLIISNAQQGADDLFIPQIHLSCLIKKFSEADNNQRPDFLLTTRNNGTKNSYVIEIDDSTHYEQSPINTKWVQKDKDNIRDNICRYAGIEPIRITKKEFDLNNEKIKYILDIIQKHEYHDEEPIIIASRIIHQIQITILHLLKEGILTQNKNKINFDIDSLPFSEKVSKQIMQIALDDLISLIDKICELYELDVSANFLCHSKEGITITYRRDNSDACVIQNILFAEKIYSPLITSDFVKRPVNIKKSTLNYFLNYLFGWPDFNKGQEESIIRALRGEDTIVLLPTGAGKSLVFQMTTLLSMGVTVTIVPIKSLMQDQIMNLKNRGINRAISINSEGGTSGYFSYSDKKDALEDAISGEFFIIYVSPERFLMEDFKQKIRIFAKKYNVCTIAIDEAHCISEWGHEFRPSYLTLADSVRSYCKNEKIEPVLLALTGTASDNVLLDIQRDLDIKNDSIISPDSFDRPELKFAAFSVEKGGKIEYLYKLLDQDIPNHFKIKNTELLLENNEDTFSGIIFCPFKSERKELGVKKISQDLKERYKKTFLEYYADNSLNKKNAECFQKNLNSVMVATKAFGMGIDKPNVRYTIHLSVPSSIESFYQEAGRAGRDKKDSRCYILYEINNYPLVYNWLEENEWNKAKNTKFKDDLYISNYFHYDNYKGIKADLKFMSNMIDKIVHLGFFNTDKEHDDSFQNFNVPDSIDNNKNSEKIDDNNDKIDNNTDKIKYVYWLKILGIISEYTCDYSNSKSFHLKFKKFDMTELIYNFEKYISKYNKVVSKQERQKLELEMINLSLKEQVIIAIEHLINFNYETFEKGRRRALKGMISLLEESSKIKEGERDEFIRTKIENYLRRSYEKDFKKIVDAEDLGFSHIKELLDEPDNYDNVQTFFGASGDIVKIPGNLKSFQTELQRTLESKPDHPGLLALMAYTYGNSTPYNFSNFSSDLIKCFQNGMKRYGADKKDLYRMIAWVIFQTAKKISSENNKEFNQAIHTILKNIPDEELVRILNVRSKKRGIKLFALDYFKLKEIYKNIEVLNRGVVYGERR